MTPELLKYLLIGFFVLLIGAIVFELSKTGFKVTRIAPDKPLFKPRSAAENNKKLVVELLLGAVLIGGIIILERCGV